jgi:hypothetical protein
MRDPLHTVHIWQREPDITHITRQRGTVNFRLDSSLGLANTTLRAFDAETNAPIFAAEHSGFRFRLDKHSFKIVVIRA